MDQCEYSLKANEGVLIFNQFGVFHHRRKFAKGSHVSEMTGIEYHALCQVIEIKKQDTQIMIAFSEKCEDEITFINQHSHISERQNTQHGLVANSNLFNDEIKPFPSNEMSNVIKDIIVKYDSCSH